MRQLLLIIIGVSLFISCDNTTKTKAISEEVKIIPHPKELSVTKNMLLLSENSKTYSSNEDLKALLQLFHSEIFKLTGIKMESCGVDNREPQWQSKELGVRRGRGRGPFCGFGIGRDAGFREQS